MLFSAAIKYIRTPAEYICALSWRRRHDDYLAIFNWHQVSPVFDPSRHHRFVWTNFEVFEAQIAFIQEHYRIMPFHEAIGGLTRGTLRGPCAALSFDDGDASMADHVLPFLLKHQLSAIFFINTAYLGGASTYWFPVLSYFSASRAACARANLANSLVACGQQLRNTSDPAFYNRVRSQLEDLAPQIADLASRLVSVRWLSTLDGEHFTIGAHGHEHQRFSMMPTQWQMGNLRQNLDVLRQFRSFRPFFAIPFGRPHDWTDETLRIADEFGVKVVLSGGGINLNADGPIERMPADNRDVKIVLRTAMAQALRETF